MFNLRSLWSDRRTTRPVRTSAPSAYRFRPQVEGFEDRTVPSAPANLGPALAAPAAATAASLLPINITSVTGVLNTVEGVTTAALSVVGTIGNQVFTTIGTLSLTQPTTGATPVLHLELNPIHLDVLGLTVDTSRICLDITADPNGGLLGSLVSDVANLLNPSGGILSSLSSVQNDLSTLLNGVLQPIGSQANAAAATGNILHLSLGPVDLNLLGLNVSLDNCNNGPVTVDIGAQSGPGKLLGNLLNSVAHLLDGPAAGNALTNALNRVAGQINTLLR